MLSLLTSNIGTSTYLSPEQEIDSKQGTIYNEKVDIFALGLILCELYSCFSTYHERIQTLTELKKLSQLPEDISLNYPIEGRIIVSLVSMDPQHRPNAEDLIKSELLQKWESVTLPQPQAEEDYFLTRETRPNVNPILDVIKEVVHDDEYTFHKNQRSQSFN